VKEEGKYWKERAEVGGKRRSERKEREKRVERG
jgi:hypothetical protein